MVGWAIQRLDWHRTSWTGGSIDELDEPVSSIRTERLNPFFSLSHQNDIISFWWFWHRNDTILITTKASIFLPHPQLLQTLATTLPPQPRLPLLAPQPTVADASPARSTNHSRQGPSLATASLFFTAQPTPSPTISYCPATPPHNPSFHYVDPHLFGLNFFVIFGAHVYHIWGGFLASGYERVGRSNDLFYEESTNDMWRGIF